MQNSIAVRQDCSIAVDSYRGSCGLLLRACQFNPSRNNVGGGSGGSLKCVESKFPSQDHKSIYCILYLLSE